MTPLNSENIKTFKEDISTLSQKDVFDIADCDNLYGKLESIISQFETAEVDPVLNNIDVQTLKRLSTSLEHIRSRMLEADPFSYPEYTAEMRNLLNLLTQSLTVEASIPGKKTVSGKFEARSQRALAHDPEVIVIPEDASPEEFLDILGKRMESMMEELKPAFNEYVLFTEFLEGLRILLNRRNQNTPGLDFVDSLKNIFDDDADLFYELKAIERFLDPSNSEEIYSKLLTGVSLNDTLRGDYLLVKLYKKFKENIGNIQNKEISTEQQLALLQHLYDCGSYERARAVCYDILKDQISAMSDIGIPLDTSIDLTSGYPGSTYGSGKTRINQHFFGKAQFQIRKQFPIESLKKDILDAAKKENDGLKEDGTPYTEYDAEREANQIFYFMSYNKHNELREKYAVDALSEKWDSRVPSVPTEKKPIWDFLKNKLGSSIPEDKHFVTNLGLEIGITAASMYGAGFAVKGLRWLTKITKLASAVEKSSRGARILMNGAGHVGSRLVEATAFETAYAGFHGRFFLTQEGAWKDILWSAATFEVLGRVHKLVGGKLLGMKYDKLGNVIEQDPKYIARLTTALPKLGKVAIENLVIQGSTATLTLMLLGLVRGGSQVVTGHLLNFSSWGKLAESLKYYGIDYSENALKEALRTYAVVLGLQLPGTVKAAVAKTPPAGQSGMPPVKETKRQRRLAREKAGTTETRELRRAQTEQKEVAKDRATRFAKAKQTTNLGEFIDAVLGPKAEAFKNMLTKSGVNTQWLEAALMDVKGHTQRCKAIEKIFDIISAETANGKKPDPKDVLNRLKEAKDPATATALEMLFKQFGSKLRFEPAEVESLFGNDNTAFIAGDIMMRGMDTPAFATRMSNYLHSRASVIENKLASLFEKSIKGETMTETDLNAAANYLRTNSLARMFRVFFSRMNTLEVKNYGWVKLFAILTALQTGCSGGEIAVGSLVTFVAVLHYAKSVFSTGGKFRRANPRDALSKENTIFDAYDSRTKLETDPKLGTGPSADLVDAGIGRISTHDAALGTRATATRNKLKDVVGDIGGIDAPRWPDWLSVILGWRDSMRGNGTRKSTDPLVDRMVMIDVKPEARKEWQSRIDNLVGTEGKYTKLKQLAKDFYDAVKKYQPPTGLAALEATLATLKTRLATEKAANARNSDGILQNLRDKAAVLRPKIDSLDAATRGIDPSQRASKDTKRTRLEGDLTLVEAEIATETASAKPKQAKLKALREERDRIEDKIEKLDKEILAIDNLPTMQAELARLRGELTSIEADITTELGRTKHDTASTEKEIKDTEDKIADMKAADTTLTEIQDKIDKAHSEYKEALGEVNPSLKSDPKRATIALEYLMYWWKTGLFGGNHPDFFRGKPIASFGSIKDILASKNGLIAVAVLIGGQLLTASGIALYFYSKSDGRQVKIAANPETHDGELESIYDDFLEGNTPDRADSKMQKTFQSIGEFTTFAYSPQGQNYSMCQTFKGLDANERNNFFTNLQSAARRLGYLE